MITKKLKATVPFTTRLYPDVHADLLAFVCREDGETYRTVQTTTNRALREYLDRQKVIRPMTGAEILAKKAANVGRLKKRSAYRGNPNRA